MRKLFAIVIFIGLLVLAGCDPNVLPENTSTPALPSATALQAAPSATAAASATAMPESAAITPAGGPAEATLPPRDAEGAAASPTPPDAALAATPAARLGFDGARAKGYVDELAGTIGRRVGGSAGERKAAEYISRQFISFGYSEVFTQPISSATNAAANVVAVRPAAADSAIIMYTAHYDSVPAGPGATDDGSGTAIMLELARVLHDRYPNYELRFVAFTSEEEGLLGSEFYVRRLSDAERGRIKAVINLDSAAVGRHLIVVGEVNLAGVALSEGTRLGLPIEDYTIYNDFLGSDHMPFMQGDVPAITLGRWLDHCYHQACDTPSRVSPQALVLMGGLSIAISDYLTK